VITAEYKLDVALYTAQYEFLRSQILGPSVRRPDGPPRALGLALFLSEGMPGWMNGVTEVLAPQAVDSAALQRKWQQPDTVTGKVLGVQPNEISTILASLILSTLPVARTSQKEGYRR